ncbi:MAG: cobalt-zinc-cadmium efflux system protein [Methylobacteriaceae bacterium]|jgi:cobalt-zinc-cadmium efflux system protein|nr:cobalt-zinc-cadmium efflux system protein [Methylobacteriaceae bacterium]
MHAHHHHGPGETHGHSHAPPPADFSRAFAIGIALNLTFVVIEAACGIYGHSIALLSDAGHNLGDVLGLAVAWGATVLARRPPTPRYTYGLGGTSILAALFNALFLLIAVGAISWEAIIRLMNPAPVAGDIVMIVAAIGIAVNGATALLFASGRKHDLNIRGAFQHMLADAVIAAGVVVTGLLIKVTGAAWLDPAASLAINLVIVWGTWTLLRDSFAMSVNAVPPSIEPDKVRRFLESLPDVARLHDLHIWAMSTTETALSGHLVMPEGRGGDAFLTRTCEELQRRFGICHVTLQIESEEMECTLAAHAP